MTFVFFLLAAACEITGYFLVWQALRLNQPWLWLPALLALAAFAWLLTLTGTASAGRAFAAYGASMSLPRCCSCWVWSALAPIFGIFWAL
ncbi:MAG: hypothetical protein JWP26_230 [Devosia sp.]|nr:hypothetical protein [Devosia sp.]